MLRRFFGAKREELTNGKSYTLKVHRSTARDSIDITLSPAER